MVTAGQIRRIALGLPGAGWRKARGERDRMPRRYPSRLSISFSSLVVVFQLRMVMLW
jgi:hypothetical protein